MRSGLLYAGTETGIYVSFDYGATWQLLQLDKQKGDAHLFRPTTLCSNLPAKSLQFSFTRPTISGLSALNWQLKSLLLFCEPMGEIRGGAKGRNRRPGYQNLGFFCL